MENYKKKLKIRIFLFAVLVALSVAAIVYDVFFADAHSRDSMMHGFETGAAVSLGFCGALMMSRYISTLKDEKKLRLEYNRENDERMKAIRSKAGIPILPVTSVLMITAGIILGYVDTTIFITLVAAAIVQLSVSLAVKFIYIKKM
ncbi:MAG: hypothetical protein Q4F95_06630 [Oscillospiraceae bacterium]|nr:hypothetical protein [Oscillospiraceae bacterium]